ncbi:MAG: ABC transporter permease [Deltaproteobacteria bacterium]|nr:MAG: ABC transporter permease [Deltaproteobacteria bacterium]
MSSRSGLPAQAAVHAFSAFGIVAQTAATFAGLLLITFLIGRVLPIDPVLAAVGERASADVYEKVRVELGLNLPLHVQFWNYAVKVLHGDLGRSVLTANPVLTDIRRVFPATLELATLGTLIGVLLGVPIGVVAAARRGGFIDRVARVFALFGYSVPIFWLGLMGLLLFYARLGWVLGPTGALLVDSALRGEWEVFRNALGHIVLPAAVLGWLSLAYISRMTRSFLLAELGEEYVTTARVKGLSEWRVIVRHALRNALVPLVTVIALFYATLLEGSVLTETVFAWPGLGMYITNSLLSADMNAVLGGTLVVGCVFIGLNLLSDLVYRLVDPRVR